MLERTGPIQDVRGEAGWMGGDRASASAILMLEHQRTAKLRFGLRRERGLWRIDDLGDLAAGAAS